MSRFNDEFDEAASNDAVPPPIEYVRLADSSLVERDLDSFSDELKEQAVEKYKIISQVDKQLTGGWTKRNLEPILDDIFSGKEDQKPNWRTVARWWKAYNESNGAITSLVPKRHRMGNGTKKVTGDEVFFDRALTRFLDAKRPSVANAYQYYCNEIEIENGHLVAGKIPTISYVAFAKRIKALPPYPVAVARHGKFIAEQWYGYFAKHDMPTRVMQRVEIDHTPLDLILLDDNLLVPLGRPYLTLLIDVFSGCVVGFHLSYKAPSYISAAKAIAHAVKPKTGLDKMSIELQNDWPCHGKIENLVVDNGAEFWSNDLEHACLEAKINIQYNPTKRPWLKPFVERFFGTMNKLFLSEIPGKTFSNILEKEEYDPKKFAVMRFSTFVEEFHRWIIDVYHPSPNSAKTRIPLVQWRRGVENLPPLTMVEEELKLFDVIMGKKELRTLTRQGIKYEDLLYHSTALSDYKKQYPQQQKTKMLIKVDPDDLSSINVYLPELESYLKVPCTDTSGYVDGLNLHHHKMIKAFHRAEITGAVDYLSLAKARMAIHERTAQEQQHFLAATSKRRIKSAKKQAQLADVSNTGTGTIQVSNTKAITVNKVDTELDEKWLESWEDDLEAFE